jgi:hypothetical protein
MPNVNKFHLFFILKFVLTLPLEFYKKLAGLFELAVGKQPGLKMFEKTKN